MHGRSVERPTAWTGVAGDLASLGATIERTGAAAANGRRADAFWNPTDELARTVEVVVPINPDLYDRDEIGVRAV